MKDLTGVLPLEPGDRAQQRGIAAPGRAEQHQELATRDGQVDLVERNEGPEVLGQVANLKMRHA